MNKISKTSLSLSAVVFFALSIFVVNVNAQCVGCVPAPPGWMCMGSGGPGGQGCITDGESCTLIGACSGNSDTPSPGGGVSRTGKCTVKNLENPLINISDSLVREVAATDPYAALALIKIRSIKAEFTVGKISFAPIDFDETDVENQLTVSQDSEYYVGLKERGKAAFAGKSKPIVYEFDINETDAGAILQIKSADSTASRSPVRIGLIKVAEDSAGRGSARFEGSSLKNK